MGLFDWQELDLSLDKEVKERLSKEVKERLSNVNMLNIIIDWIKELGAWTTKTKGFYDHRCRNVIVTKDYLAIQDSKETFEKELLYSDEIPIFYASYNYKALHTYHGKGANIPLGDIILIWANVIKERIKMEFPELNICDISIEKDVARFSYIVPDKEYNNWF